MGKKWKTRIVVGLFVCGGLGFVLALLPGLSSIFWLLWLTGCAAFPADRLVAGPRAP